MLCGAGLLTISTAFEGEATAQRVGGNEPVNAGATVASDFTSHNSPTIVRNPREPDQLAVANRIDTPRYSCALHVSSDGGNAWRQTPVPVPEGEEPKCYAPDVGFAGDGTLYLTFVTLQGRGNVPSAAWLVRSTNGGRTLSAPERVLDELAFQVRLVADPDRPRRLYLSWLQAEEVGVYRFTELGNPIMLKVSDDGGRTWRAPVRISSSARPRAVAGSVAVGAHGHLFALYLDLGEDRLEYEGAHEGQGGAPYPGPWRLVLARSTDDGRTWRERVVEPRLVPTERFIVFIPPYPSLATDPARNRIYVSFHDGRMGDPDVWLWRSDDGGRTFSDRIRVNDTRARDKTSQYLPEIAIAPGGRLDVLYYDRRADPSDTMNEVSLQSSYDGGESFLPRIALSERAFDSRVGFGFERDLPDLGNRLGAVASNSATLAVWADTRAGTTATKKQDLALALVAFTQPTRLSDSVKWGARVAGALLVLAGAGWLAARRRRGRAGR